MVDLWRLLAQMMLPNSGLSPGFGPGLGPGIAPTQDEYQSPEYNPQSRSLVPLSSSNPFLNQRMMLMMMIEKMRANKVSLNHLILQTFSSECWPKLILSPIQKIVRF